MYFYVRVRMFVCVNVFMERIVFNEVTQSDNGTGGGQQCVCCLHKIAHFLPHTYTHSHAHIALFGHALLCLQKQKTQKSRMKTKNTKRAKTKLLRTIVTSRCVTVLNRMSQQIIATQWRCVKDQTTLANCKSAQSR